ncbi:hypothetical protein Tco_1082012 [Tanacetum coccineum]|uniref:Uncharacterized protein n=1 Tax=Tanacetum coccineum TaxID=301880 RepID=A0ABQ5HZA5_9ASTR
MAKAKQNKQKSIFKQTVQAKVLTEMKKQLPTHVPTAIAKFVKPRLNNTVLEVMKNNQINLYTTPSPTTTDDLSEIDLKLKLLNKMYKSKSFESHDTHHKLYDGEKRKKSRKDVGEPSFRSLKKYKAPMDSTQKDIHVDQPQDQEEEHCILGLLTFAVAKKIKEIIKKDELTIADLEGVGLEMLKRQYKNDVKPEYHQHMSKSKKPHNCFYNSDFYYLLNLSTREKYTTSLTKHFAARYHTEEFIIEKMQEKISLRQSWVIGHQIRSTLTKESFFVKVNAKVNVKKKWGYSFLMSIVVRRLDNREYEFRYADLPRLSLNDVEDMYLLKVQDKLYHLKLDFEIDFINALLLFIRRVVIQNLIEDL